MAKVIELKPAKRSYIKFTIKSSQPMLQNALTAAALDKLPGGTGKMKQPEVKEMSIVQRAELVRYKGPNGEFGVPAYCLFASLVDAGRSVTFSGKRKISTKDQSVLAGALTITEDFLPFKDQDPKSWHPDSRRAVNPATDGAMCVVRPMFDKWELDVTVELNEASGITEDKLRQLFETAGRESGLGDHRKKGSFGRFDLVRIEVLEEALAKAA